MTNSIVTKALCAVAAVAVSMTSLSASASAQSHTVRTAIVEYGDLDLTSAEGKSTLDARLRGAVRQVCGGYDSRNLFEVADHSNCVKEARASARRATVTLIAAAEAGELTETAIMLGQ